MADPIQQRAEALGPAERLIQALLTHADHMVHNRPGIVSPAPASPTGVKWEYATYKVEAAGEAPPVKVAYVLRQQGKKVDRIRAGIIGADSKVREGGRVVGDYRQPGLFPEVAEWIYRQIAEVYKMDHEFVARWASYAFPQEHKDLKVALAAFLLVQERRGDPVRDSDGKILFHDEDYRDVGEAMCLIRRTDKRDIDPKLLLRIGDLLELPQIAAINRELGFTRSAKNPALGRYERAVTKYLTHRETNPWMLESAVKKGGFRTTLVKLAQRVRYKPLSPKFFQVLRWKQAQAKDGRRNIAIGVAVEAAESWEGLTEAQICERIVATRPAYKRLVGLLPSGMGLTRAIVAAAVEAGSLSDQDMIIAAPTFEELGLLDIEPVKSRLASAMARAENQRAANIAARVKNTDVKQALQAAADTAVKKAVEEVIRGLRVYFFVDVSGSMQNVLAEAKTYITALLGGFPLDKLHVAVFDTRGVEITIKHPSKEGVEAAFRGHHGGGGTDYLSGVRVLANRKPAPDEDVLFIFVGDEQHPGEDFSAGIRATGLNPVAFGLLKIGGHERDRGVRNTATQLGIPCFPIDKGIFADPYAIPRTIRALIAATPVGKATPGFTAAPRVSLVENILKTDLLTKPAWAA